MQFFSVAIAGLLGCCLYAGVALSEETGKAEARPGMITFLSRRAGPLNLLYRARPNGSGVTRVFGGKLEKVAVVEKGREVHREAHWMRQSPNGKWFAGWAKDELRPLRNCDSQFLMIYVGATDGSWTRVLVPNGEEEVAWSPDSSRIAYSVLTGVGRTAFYGSRVASTEIAVIGVDGSNIEYVFEQPDIWTVEDWSPDGKRLLLLHQTTAEITNQDGQRERLCELGEYDLAAALASRPKPAPEPSWGQGDRGNQWATTAGQYFKTIVPVSPHFSPCSGALCPERPINRAHIPRSRASFHRRNHPRRRQMSPSWKTSDL